MFAVKVAPPEKELGQENRASHNGREGKSAVEGIEKGGQKRVDPERGDRNDRCQLQTNEEADQEIRERWRLGVEGAPGKW